MHQEHPSAPVVEFDSVLKAYDNHIVLDRVNLFIEPGEMIALTGPSGSGKSTVLNLVGLLESPDHGRIRLFGDPAPRLHTRRATAMLRHRLGYLFQNFALIESATVEENLAIALTYSNGPRHRTRMRKVLNRVGLSGFEQRKIYTLSGGEQQRVALARLWLKPCDLVLADEPTGSLDNANSDEILNLLRAMNEDGRTILLATHDPVIVATCTRAIDVQELNHTDGRDATTL